MPSSAVSSARWTPRRCWCSGFPTSVAACAWLGRTGPLTLPARRELDGLLVPPQRAHPWPEGISSSRFGQLPPQPVDYTHTEPLLVVEVDADICSEQQRWRHATTYRRVRGDLEPADLAKTLPGQRLTRDRSARVLPADQMADLDG
jgi:hypothetical protein